MERKDYLLGLVEKHRDLIFEAEKFIWEHPETGYKEWTAHKYLADKFKEFGYELVEAGDIPGFYTDLDTGKTGPTLLILGELDALTCSGHPEAVDGAAHACGHCCQAAGLLGLAAALKEEGALEGLCGKIRLMAVPAEELIETDFRQTLKDKGTIRLFSGKTEFMRRGYMKDCDISFMLHTTNGEFDFRCAGGSNGLISKEVIYHGRASHAAGSPDKGINALYAANLGLSAVNAVRETFIEEKRQRVQGIITTGGFATNVIPDYIRIEMMCRANSWNNILELSEKVDKALEGGALALGCTIDINNGAGYAPLHNCKELADVFEECALNITTPDKVSVDFTAWSGGSTDMGDLSEVMPSIHPYAGGAVGTGHGTDYFISDKEKACVNPAKVEILMIDALLKDGAEKAKSIIENFTPNFKTQDDYVQFLEDLVKNKKPIVYKEDGSVEIKA